MGYKKQLETTSPVQEGIKSLFSAVCPYHSSVTCTLNILPFFLFLSTPVRMQDRASRESMQISVMIETTFFFFKTSRALISAERVTQEKPIQGTKSSRVAGGQMRCVFQGRFHLCVPRRLVEFNNHLTSTYAVPGPCWCLGRQH